jgi:hypothetical protein
MLIIYISVNVNLFDENTVTILWSVYRQGLYW